MCLAHPCSCTLPEKIDNGQTVFGQLVCHCQRLIADSSDKILQNVDWHQEIQGNKKGFRPSRFFPLSKDSIVYMMHEANTCHPIGVGSGQSALIDRLYINTCAWHSFLIRVNVTENFCWNVFCIRRGYLCTCRVFWVICCFLPKMMLIGWVFALGLCAFSDKNPNELNETEEWLTQCVCCQRTGEKRSGSPETQTRP